MNKRRLSSLIIQDITRLVEAQCWELGEKIQTVSLITSQAVCVGMSVCVVCWGRWGAVARSPALLGIGEYGAELEKTSRGSRSLPFSIIGASTTDTVLSAGGVGHSIWARIRGDKLLWSKPILNLFNERGNYPFRRPREGSPLFSGQVFGRGLWPARSPWPDP